MYRTTCLVGSSAKEINIASQSGAAFLTCGDIHCKPKLEGLVMYQFFFAGNRREN
jgi:hypothetical protein